MATSLSHQLGQAVDKREYSDIEFLVGPKQTPVYASRLILVVRSPVFAAQFMGGFKEAHAPPFPSPPTSTSTSSSSPSSPSSSSSPPGDDTSNTTAPSVLPPSLSVPPLFWRSTLLEVEPTIFRHLLHCCYTDQLPPDDAYGDGDDTAGEPDHQRRARDLVSLFAAADRFLLDHCKQLVRDKLEKTIDNSNVLVAFDHALAVAPELANSGLFLPIISANAAELLGNTDAEAEAQWLAMSTAGAAAVVACNLSGLREVDLFRAVERWYRHLADGDDEEHHLERSSVTKEERVARVLAGMQYLLMSTEELRDVVEKSGLVSDKELLAAYRECSHYHRMVLPCALPESTTPVTFSDRVTIRDGQMVWYAKLAKKGGRYIIYIYNQPQATYLTPPSGRVSYAGISVRLYLDRQCHAATFNHDSSSAVSSGNGLYMCEPPQLTPKHVLVLVHVPAFAMGQQPK